MVSYSGATIYGWLFTKCFHEKLQGAPEGSVHSSASSLGGQRGCSLDAFQMIVWSRHAIEKFLSVRSESGFERVEGGL